jgi:multiple sugar transport system permease protein
LKRRTREAVAAYLFLAPAVLGLLIFIFTPMFYAFWVSLHKWDALSEMIWVGFENYSNLFSDKEWGGSLGRTFVYTILFVPSLYAISLIMALIVKSVPHISGFFRTTYFLPVVMSSAIAGLVWKYIYAEKDGILNYSLGLFGVEPIAWLSSLQWALISVVIVSVWLAVGFNMIIFLAGLQDIPKEFYEAAKIDGAGSWQSFWKITLPNLKHTSIFIVLTSIIGSFQVFDQIMLMTNGGPANATRLAVQHIFEQSFVLYDLGYASALSFNLFVIILLFTLVQVKLLKINKE